MPQEALIATIAGGAVLLLVLVVLLAKKSAKPKNQKICGGCKRAMLPVWTKCLFCGWAPGARLEFILGPMANQTLQLDGDVTTIGSVGARTFLAPSISSTDISIELVRTNPPVRGALIS